MSGLVMEMMEEAIEISVPCGHEGDCVRIVASAAVVIYCSRCERAYEAAGPTFGLAGRRDGAPLLVA